MNRVAHSLLLLGPRQLQWARKHAAWFFEAMQRSPSRLTDVFQLEIQSDALDDTFKQLASGAIKPVKVLVRYR